MRTAVRVAALAIGCRRAGILQRLRLSAETAINRKQDTTKLQNCSFASVTLRLGQRVVELASGIKETCVQRLLPWPSGLELLPQSSHGLRGSFCAAVHRKIYHRLFLLPWPSELSELPRSLPAHSRSSSFCRYPHHSPPPRRLKFARAHSPMPLSDP